MKKVLFIENRITNYRLPIYNLLSKRIDLTVMVSEGEILDGCEFKTIYVKAEEHKHFKIHKKNIRKIASQYDVVIGMMSFNWISIYMLAFGRRKYKFIPWGIGVPASYSVKYDDDAKRMNRLLTNILIRKSDAAIFYSDYPKEKYARKGILCEKMFVASNTVNVEKIELDNDRDSVLFVGSLYKAKSLVPMLEIYKSAYFVRNDIPKLIIVGDGEEYNDLYEWVKKNKLDDKVILKGAIFDEPMLASIFSKAFLCISLGQAGLSVQKSMGYGVPFVTMKDSYTGGERFDIENLKTGFLLDSENDLKDILIDIPQNQDKYIEMGYKAHDFYWNNRTIDHMVNNMIAAIDYVS